MKIMKPEDKIREVDAILSGMVSCFLYDINERNHCCSELSDVFFYSNTFEKYGNPCTKHLRDFRIDTVNWEELK